MSRAFTGVVLLAFAACASTVANLESLEPAIQSYNRSLRWKRFDHAARYLPASAQALFLERYLATEDDLHINSLEVRAVDWVADADPPAARVMVVAESYTLPSTVVDKTIMQQRWEFRGGTWLLMSTTQELAPELEALDEKGPEAEKGEPRAPQTGSSGG